MRQLITRVDDDLHERLRALAAAEGRSMASVVRDAIATALHRSGAATTLDDRIAASGLVTRPPRPQVPPPIDVDDGRCCRHRQHGERGSAG